MNDVGKSQKDEATLALGSSVAQASSEATRRLCEQGQTFVGAMTEWNNEISQFVSNCIARNGDTFARLTKCQGFPDALAIQAQWIRDATDDYSKEMQKLMKVNSRMMTQLAGSGSQAHSAPTKSALKPAE